MAHDRVDPTDQIPEADLLDQLAPLDPNALNDPVAAATRDPSASPVDEADHREQQTVVPDAGEDDYPHDPTGP